MSLFILYFTFLAWLSPLSETDLNPIQDKTVTIGLLVSHKSQNEIIHAAELAIETKNLKGGFNGHPFKLVVRSTEGPWGAGSKESVSLVYEDDVRAFVGSLDGRNGHLAEQVAAKSHLAYLETRTSEPTLSQAYVPWFLRIVPNDNQQAQAILDLIGEKGRGKTALLLSEDYDAKYAAKALTKYSAQTNGISPLIIAVNPNESSTKSAVDQLKKAGSDHLIIPYYSDTALGLVADLREKLPHLKVYGTLAFSMGINSRSDLKNLEGMILLQAFKGADDQSPIHPGKLASSYTFDGVTLILNAILKVGLDRESISDFLAGGDHPNGKTGPFRFDDMGNRTGNIRFVQILNGEVVSLMECQ